MDRVELGGRMLEMWARADEGVSHIISNEAMRERLRHIPTQLGPYGVDPFGFDPPYLARFLGLGEFLYRHYFRCNTRGAEHIPNGRCLLVANHSGQLPWDAAMLAMAVFLEREPPRMVRTMVERFVPSTPFVSPILARMGQILGTPENCRRLLQAEEMIQVFPEGVRGLNKTFWHRYRLQRFGHGFVRLAIEMRTPIVPAVVVGAEEQAPSFANLRRLGRAVGIPAFPLTPAPLFGLLPLPVRYHITFGAPIVLEGDANDEDDVIAQHTEAIRQKMQGMLDASRAERQHIFW
jgi:1-acyl-sn-glycerol-3-phosphate acyltransferase